MQFRNPVIFIVELGSVITTVIFFIGLFSAAATTSRSGSRPRSRSGSGSRSSSPISPRRSRKAAARPRPTPCARPGRRPWRRGSRRRRSRRCLRRSSDAATSWSSRPASHPGRRRDHRGCRLRRRVGDHGRVRPGDPRGRRRPLGRHRRHAAALGPARHRGHPGAGPVVPRPHDRARRGRRAAQDPERDRAQHPARRADHHLPRRGRDPATVRRLRRHRAVADGARSRSSSPSIPTTIGALLSAIGIAGMDRLVQRNVLAMSGRAVEASGDVDVLLLDKTGTITLGNRQAAEFLPVDGSGASSSSPKPRSSPRSPTRRRRDVRSSCSRRSGSASATGAGRARVRPVLRSRPA